MCYIYLKDMMKCSGVSMDKAELYYQVAHSHLQEQDQRNRDFDMKAIGVIGVSATLAGIAAIVLKDFSGASTDLSTLPIALTIFVGITFLAAFCFGLNTVRPGKWRRDPNLNDFASHLPDYADDVLIEWAGDQFRNAVEKNDAALKMKATSVLCAIIALFFLAAALIALAVSVRI